MKQLLSFVFLFLLVNAGLAQADRSKKITLNKLEDFFRFDNVEQLESYFGKKNVFTEIAFYGDPNEGNKSYLVSQVKFTTPQSVLVIWNGAGNVVCEVQTSAFYFDFVSKELKKLTNNWKTRQGVFAGMPLSSLVRINWWQLAFYVQDLEQDGKEGMIILKNGVLLKKNKVSFSNQKLVYEYNIDMKDIRKFFPEITTPILISNNKMVKKWNPILGLISIYREGLRPENNGAEIIH